MPVSRNDADKIRSALDALLTDHPDYGTADLKVHFRASQITKIEAIVSESYLLEHGDRKEHADA